MKLDRVNVAFGAASAVLFGVLVACGGDDDDDIVPGTSSSGGSSGGDASVSSSSSSGGSSGASSSSGGANSCQPEYGCYKNTLTQVANGDPLCPELAQTTYTETKATPAGDAGPVVDAGPNPCDTTGSDESQCLSKLTCTTGDTKTTITTKVEGNKTTSTNSRVTGDAAACESTYVSEPADPSFCVVDAGPDAATL